MPERKDLRVVIVGSGRTGLQTARRINDRGHDVVIIERNPERVQALVDERVARSNTTLTPGSRYVVAVEPDVADEVMNLLRG